jgi:hypothetical protein
MVGATVALLLAMSLPAGCQAQPPLNHMQRITGTLNLPEGGICSATAIGPHAIATASHCMATVKDEVRFRGINYRVVKVMHDGKDHALVILDGDMGAFARRGRNARLGETLWMWGNPMGLPQVLRRGEVSRVSADETLLDCRCFNGDSGMGLFNEAGQLVGVFSGAYTERGALGSLDFTFPVYFPFRFSAAQWAEARS